MFEKLLQLAEQVARVTDGEMVCRGLLEACQRNNKLIPQQDGQQSFTELFSWCFFVGSDLLGELLSTRNSDLFTHTFMCVLSSQWRKPLMRMFCNHPLVLRKKKNRVHSRNQTHLDSGNFQCQ